MSCNPGRLAFAPMLILLGLIPAQSVGQTPDAAQNIFKHYFETKLQDEPEFATTTGHYENADKWNDWSKAGRELRRKHAEETLSDLEKLPAQEISGADDVSVRLLKYDLRLQLEADDLETHLLRVGQLFGLHTRVYTTIDRMPARTVHDYENLLARLHGVPVYVDQNIDILKESIARGLTQPRLVVDLVTKQIAAQVAQDQATTPLLIPFRHFPSNFPQEQQTKLRDEAVATYEKEFVPAWKKLLAFLQTTYAPKARPQIGLSTLPGGREDYAILVRRLTTTNTSPDEIHKIGEMEVQRIETEMLAVARETGFTGTISEFDKELDGDPAQHFRSKDEMLIFCRNVAKIIEPELPNQFKHIPMMLYGVRAIPEDREQATASNAEAPAPDGSVPGWFNLNTYQPEKQARYDKEALTLHEAVPGHIFQGSLARSQQGLPEFRRFYGNSAYGEGWALYAESLGSQLGLYRDPYSHYGELASERFRAVRLVVDTGIHAMGWTREQAVDYFGAHAPEIPVAEIDRYISWPGQALAYKTGQLKILELRKEAEQKLGPKFDIRDFHDAVLRDGRLPLELLQEQVEKYINNAK
jgi:prolyl oligopeptidase